MTRTACKSKGITRAFIFIIMAAILLTGCRNTNDDSGKNSTEVVYTGIEDTGVTLDDYYDVYALGEGYFSVTNDDFIVGIVNYKGEIILPCEYNSVRPISDGVIAVRGEKGWGYFNPSLSRFIVECTSRDLSDFTEGCGLYQDGKEYRFVLPDGSDAVPGRYFEAAPFKDGLARVISDNGVGYINKDGKFEIYCDFDYFDDFYEGFARISDNGKLGFMNKEGKAVFTLNANSVYPFSEGVAQFTIDSKLGFIDTEGKIVIEPSLGAMPTKMQEIYYSFTNGAAPFRDSETEKYGFINKKGEIIIEPVYNMVMYPCEGISRVRHDNKLYGYVTADGKTVSECIFRDATRFSGGTATVCTDDGYYFIDRNGKELTSDRYDDATNFSGEYAAVYKDGIWHILKKTAK